MRSLSRCVIAASVLIAGLVVAGGVSGPVGVASGAALAEGIEKSSMPSFDDCPFDCCHCVECGQLTPEEKCIETELGNGNQECVDGGCEDGSDCGAGGLACSVLLSTLERAVATAERHGAVGPQATLAMFELPTVGFEFSLDLPPDGLSVAS